jgi:hypothetical protein
MERTSIKNILVLSILIFAIQSEIVLASDDIYVIDENKLSKNTDFTVILNEKINLHAIDTSNIYLTTPNYIYIINSSTGNISYKIRIFGIDKITLSDNFVYVASIDNVYQIQKNIGIIVNKYNRNNNDIFTMLNISTLGTGTNGIDGINGINGTNGLDGSNGIDGTNGIDGINGTNTQDHNNLTNIQGGNEFEGFFHLTQNASINAENIPNCDSGTQVISFDSGIGWFCTDIPITISNNLDMKQYDIVNVSKVWNNNTNTNRLDLNSNVDDGILLISEGGGRLGEIGIYTDKLDFNTGNGVNNQMLFTESGLKIVGNAINSSGGLDMNGNSITNVNIINNSLGVKIDGGTTSIEVDGGMTVLGIPNAYADNTLCYDSALGTITYNNTCGTDSSDNTKVNKSGDSMTGNLILKLSQIEGKNSTDDGQLGFFDFIEQVPSINGTNVRINIGRGYNSTTATTALGKYGYNVGYSFQFSSYSNTTASRGLRYRYFPANSITASTFFTSNEIDTTVNLGNMTVSTLAGSGNAYACLDSTGKLFRSAIACPLV